MTPCAGCVYRAALFGMIYCIRDQWAGLANEKICAEFKRKPRESDLNRG